MKQFLRKFGVLPSLLILALLLALTACGTSTQISTDPTVQPQSQPTATNAPVAAPTEEIPAAEALTAETPTEEVPLAEAPTEEPPAVAVPAAEPKMVTVSPNGRAYSWQPKGIYFVEDSDMVLVDYCHWDLRYPIQTLDGVSFLSIQDMEILYAPDFTCDYDDDADSFIVRHAGVEAQFHLEDPTITYYGGSYTMEAAPFQDGEALYLPIYDFLGTAFGKTKAQNGVYYGLGNTSDFDITRDDVYNLKMFFRGKPVGKSYWAYWNSEAEHLEPVVVYIPSTYSADTPNKAIVQLHGAGGNAFGIPDSDRGVLMMQEAEEYGYIVVWPNGYSAQANFGNWVPPAGQIPVTPDTDPDNPGGYNDGWLADIRISGNNVIHALDFVKDHWSVDSENVFCMGISMGACGTWYQAAFHDQYFSAFSPSGAFVEPEFFPWEKVTKPVQYVGGTEDRNGYDLMVRAYDIALSKDCNIVEFITVGGAPHGGEWPVVLTRTFDFFESYLTTAP